MTRRTLARHGHRLDGAGWNHPYADPFVCYADGGDGGGSGSDDPANGATPITPPAAPATPPAPATEGDVKSLPDWAQKALADARSEAAKSRTTAKANAADQARQQLAQEIGKALGLVKDNAPADPAQLTRTIGEQTSRITDLETTARTQTIELAAYKAAAKHGADPAALLDSRTFLTSVNGLDPNADDFTTKLDDAIKAAIEQNQQLRTGQAPRRGGGDFNGGPGATPQRPTSLGQAISRAMTG
ncbi:hypothetical protein [Streptomyces sp. NPDC047315]|uniref:hypothetical protein n=1 Tax=Streptomyces sp. NPDC047315 TaxID=3155142 RepID=UPI0033DB7B5A